MANHVIYDRLWESKKLARCSREAALAYPWIFLVADDHGRFELHPRRIWTKVFGSREDVTLEDVTSWLQEYEHEGLLIRYGDDLAYWSKFKGRRPSERRQSEHPDPAKVKRHPAETPRKDRDDVAEEPRAVREKVAPELDQIGSEQSRSETDQTTATAAAAAATEDQAKILRGIRCLRCDTGQLQRETGQYGQDGATRGRGWVCSKRAGGCGATYVREDPLVTRQLTARALEALTREIATEDEARARGAETAAVEAVIEEPEPAARDLWDRVLGHLEGSIDRHIYGTWFRPTQGMSLDGDELVVRVPKEQFRTWIVGNYRAPLVAAMRAAGASGLRLVLQPPKAPAGARRTG